MRTQEQSDEPILYIKAANEINSPLLKHAKDYNSQCGEDGIIEALINILSLQAGKFCEFGAWDGIHLSNTRYLAEKLGWSGLYIEGDSLKYDNLVSNYAENKKITCVNAFVEISGINSLDNLLASHSAEASIDILSIDIDGMDFYIWQSLISRPAIVIIEFNPSVPNDVVFVQPCNSALNQGCSLLALITLAQTKGYSLACATNLNAFFVVNELFWKLEIKDNSINSLYKPMQNGRIFHGYDSHIYTIGMERLLWSQNVTLNHSDLQALPKSQRRVWGR